MDPLMHKFKSADQSWLGNFGEEIWSKVFEASGLGYIPLSKINTGRAPMMLGNDKTILPDFDVFGKWTAYIDSKAKTKCVLWEKWNEDRHGIDKRNYANYQAMAFTGKKRAGLAIVELFESDGQTWSGSLLAESFVDLDAPYPGIKSQSHMVYWPRKRFRFLAAYSPDELLGIASGRIRVSHEAELSDIFGRPPKREEQHVLFA